MNKEALKVALELNRCKSKLAFMELEAIQKGEFEFVKALDKSQKLIGEAVTKIERGVFDVGNVPDVHKE